MPELARIVRRRGARHSSYGVIEVPPATGGAEDAATTAWVNAVGSGNVSAGRRTIVDTLIKALKAGTTSSNDIFAKLDRLWWLSAENGVCSLTDLKALAVATNNGMTFTVDRGYAGNGTTQAINTGFNPTTNGVNVLQNSTCFFFYQRTSSTTDGQFGGGIRDTVGTLTTWGIFYDSANGGFWTEINDAGGGRITATTVNRQGFYAVNRSGAGARQIYRNGSLVGQDTLASNALPDIAAFVGARNNDGSIAADNDTGQYALYGTSGSLIAAEQLDLYNAIQAAMTSIGANV